MARARSNGHAKLDDALASLIQAQAALAQNQATMLAEKAVADRRFADLEMRLNRIEQDIAEFQRSTAKRFDQIETILLEHNRILTALPDQLREKIGFKAPG